MSIYDNDTDDESYSSMDETDDDSDCNLVYEPEEPSNTRYNIVICEKYNQRKHGISDDGMQHYYLTHIRFKSLDQNLLRSIMTDSALRLEIAQCIYLPSNYCVSIIKTMWIKFIQRTWRRVLKERNQFISKMSTSNILQFREIHGKWTNIRLKYPGLKGMLSSLSRTSSRRVS